MRFESERFTVPEILFHPSDVGLEQGGLHELIKEAISNTNPALHPLFYSNILLTGGVCKAPNILTRLYKELRPLVPSHFQVNIRLVKKSDDGTGDDDFDNFAWKGAALIAQTNQQVISNSSGTKPNKAKKAKKNKGNDTTAEEDAVGGGAAGGKLTIKHVNELPSAHSSIAYVPTISKAEYEEMGADYCNEKFRYW